MNRPVPIETASSIVSVSPVWIETLSLEVVIPTVVTVPMVNVSASRNEIAPAVLAASVLTSLVVLVPSENVPSFPVLSKRNPSTTIVPVPA